MDDVDRKLVVASIALAAILAIIAMLLPLPQECLTCNCDVETPVSVPCSDLDGLCIGSQWVWSYQARDNQTIHILATLTGIGTVGDVMMYDTDHSGPLAREEFLNRYVLFVPVD